MVLSSVNPLTGQSDMSLSMIPSAPPLSVSDDDNKEMINCDFHHHLRPPNPTNNCRTYAYINNNNNIHNTTSHISSSHCSDSHLHSDHDHLQLLLPHHSQELKVAPTSKLLLIVHEAERQIITCYQRCLVCHQPVDLIGIRPVVCSSPLCNLSYEELGVGIDLDVEIVRDPAVTDLLISMLYAAVFGGRVELMYPRHVTAIGPDGEMMSFMKPSTRKLTNAISDSLSPSTLPVTRPAFSSSLLVGFPNFIHKPSSRRSVTSTGQGTSRELLLDVDHRDEDLDMLKNVMNLIPALTELCQVVKEGNHLREHLRVIHPLIYPLLQWMFTSNRSHLRLLKPHEKPQSLKASHIFVLLTAPYEKELKFQQLKSAAAVDMAAHPGTSVTEIIRQQELSAGLSRPGKIRAISCHTSTITTPAASSSSSPSSSLHKGSFFAFHGSATGNWHSILRLGVKSFSNTRYMSAGAAFGPGAYFADHLSTSLRYCNSGAGLSNTSWPQSQFGYSSRFMAACEIIDRSSDFKIVSGLGSRIFVIPQEHYIATRFLLVNPTSNSENTTIASHLDFHSLLGAV